MPRNHGGGEEDTQIQTFLENESLTTDFFDVMINGVFEISDPMGAFGGELRTKSLLGFYSIFNDFFIGF